VSAFAGVRHVPAWPQVDAGPYDDGAPGYVATLGDLFSTIVGHGDNEDEAEADLVEALASLTWH
jgi:hypothetical protein